MVYEWPDGTWVHEDDFSEEEWAWKSDDYALVPYDETRHN